MAPPGALPEAACAEWRAALAAAPPGLLTPFDRPVLEIYATAMALARDYYAQLVEQGPMVAGRNRSGTAGGRLMVRNPLTQLARDQAQLALQAAQLLGISPVVRARMGEKKPEDGGRGTLAKLRTVRPAGRQRTA